MKRSVTIKLDDEVLKWARHEAVNADKSLTAWVTEVLTSLFTARRAFRSSAPEAIAMIDNARHAGGQRFNREELYSERIGRHK